MYSTTALYSLDLPLIQQTPTNDEWNAVLATSKPPQMDVDIHTQQYTHEMDVDESSPARNTRSSGRALNISPVSSTQQRSPVEKCRHYYPPLNMQKTKTSTTSASHAPNISPISTQQRSPTKRIRYGSPLVIQPTTISGSSTPRTIHETPAQHSRLAKGIY